MRLETLAIRGFLAIDRVQQIDLRDLPAGLIALVGPNGAGKTTILDAALGALYRQFPSRGAKELVDYALDREAFLDATFAVEGRGLYRARVNVDGVRRQSEAVLELIDADGEHRLLNDGKVSTFDAVVAKVFPPLRVVLASAMSAQNKAGSFITLDRRGRKDLFAELLDLQIYEVLAGRARQAAARVEQARAAVVALRDRLTRETGPAVETALSDRANGLQVDVGLVERRRDEITAALDAIARERDTCQDAAARYAIAQTTRDRCQVEITTFAKTRARLDQQLEQLQTDATAEHQRIDAQLAKTDRSLEREEQGAETTARDALAAAVRTATETRDDLDTRIANNRRLVAEADAIRAAVAALAQAETRLPSAKATVEAATQEQQTLERKGTEVERQLAALDVVGRELERAQRAASLLTRVPFGENCGTAGCEFVTEAVTARGTTAGLEGQLSGRDALREELHATRQQLADVKAQRTTDVTGLTALEAEIADLKVRTKHASQIDVAEARIADYARQVPAVETALAERRTEVEAQRRRTVAAIEERRAAARLDATRAHADLDARIAPRVEAVKAERERVDGAIVDGRAALAAADAQLATTADAHRRLQQLDGEHTAQQRAWAATEADRGRLEAERAALERDWLALGDRQRELDDVARQLATLDQDLVEWQLLGRIFSRDGLPVLEIAAAGPTVSAYTTDLLQSCSGPRFTVDLVTQEAKVSGKGGLKEVFELKVFDGERGGEPRDLTDLSGGEQILVDECLKSAIAIYLNERSATPIRTCWRDETTGALHPETVPHYVAMLRRLQAVGGFHQVLFVTHSPDAAAQADAQIQVGGGTARLVFPPYEQMEAA
jgi:exonuclease SbcC